MKRILIIEDHKDISGMLVEALEDAGYETRAAYNGVDGLGELRCGGFDLVLLDIMLPYLNGDELLRELRRTSSVPVIVISAKDGVHTKVELLALGADDYVTKPFDILEVLARVEANLRRAGIADQESAVIRHEDMALDLNAKRVTVGGVTLDLTGKEYAILELMLRYKNKVFTRANLFESIWGQDFIGDDSVLKAHISNLRAKLKMSNPDAEYIETVWGIGYRLKKTRPLRLDTF